MNKMISSFSNTENKNKVRELDLSHIRRLAKIKKLGYFGMPGAKALDILHWKDCIEFIHAVEWGYQEAIELEISLMEAGMINPKFKIFKGDVCDIINNKNNLREFDKYELINLDFEGVLVSSTSSTKGNTRLEAIEDLIKLQAKKFKPSEELLFIVTFYGTRNYTEDLDEALDEISISLVNSLQDKGIQEKCEQLKKSPQSSKIMAIFPVWFLSKSPQFSVKCMEIIFYIGTGNSPMVHFIFKLKRKKSGVDLSPFSNISQIKSIPLRKITKIKNGKIVNNNSDILEFN